LSRQSLEKYSNVKFNENLSIGRRVVSQRRANGQREIWTDNDEALRKFATTLKSREEMPATPRQSQEVQ